MIYRDQFRAAMELLTGDYKTTVYAIGKALERTSDGVALGLRQADFNNAWVSSQTPGWVPQTGTKNRKAADFVIKFVQEGRTLDNVAAPRPVGAAKRTRRRAVQPEVSVREKKAIVVASVEKSPSMSFAARAAQIRQEQKGLIYEALGSALADCIKVFTGPVVKSLLEEDNVPEDFARKLLLSQKTTV